MASWSAPIIRERDDEFQQAKALECGAHDLEELDTVLNVFR
jgi:hypothetical protein